MPKENKDFLFGDTSEVTEAKAASDTADAFMEALTAAGGKACASRAKCAVCLHPCEKSAVAPLASVVEHQTLATETLAIMTKALSESGQHGTTSTTMSAGAKLAGLTAMTVLAEADGVSRMMLKLQSAAAYERLEQTIGGFFREDAMSSLPVILALAKHLDKLTTLGNTAVVKELGEFLDREGKQQA